MNATDDPQVQRLDRLEGYLREDPTNARLLGEACDAALGLQAAERAAAHLGVADDLQLADAGWQYRRARLAALQQDWAQALCILQRLREAVGEHAGIAHDIACAHLCLGDAARCAEVLLPWRDQALPDPHTRDALQALWLRAMHRLPALDEAWLWASDAEQRGTLQPGAAGVASLVAIDLGEFEAARRWSGFAHEAGCPPQEAAVARAAVAMAEGKPQAALGALRAAVQRQPADGRTWSALGLASLQARDAVAARSQFARASQLMPSHIGTWHGLGWSCLLLGDRAGALAAFQQALQLDANFAESHGAVGLALSLAGRGEEAEHHLLRADRLDRRNVTARYARALAAGKAQDAAALRQLAGHLLDRPGFFGRRLGDLVQGADWQQEPPSV